MLAFNSNVILFVKCLYAVMLNDAATDSKPLISWWLRSKKWSMFARWHEPHTSTIIESRADEKGNANRLASSVNGFFIGLCYQYSNQTYQCYFGITMGKVPAKWENINEVTNLEIYLKYPKLTLHLKFTLDYYFFAQDKRKQDWRHASHLWD